MAIKDLIHLVLKARIHPYHSPTMYDDLCYWSVRVRLGEECNLNVKTQHSKTKSGLYSSIRAHCLIISRAYPRVHTSWGIRETDDWWVTIVRGNKWNILQKSPHASKAVEERDTHTTVRDVNCSDFSGKFTMVIFIIKKEIRHIFGSAMSLWGIYLTDVKT